MKTKGGELFKSVKLYFLCASVFLFIRPVDGHGTMQTLEVKLISFAV